MASYEYDSQNQELKRIAGGTLYADMPIGSEIEYAGTTAPTGFLKCDGSTYSQVTYPELYAILGTTTLPNKSGYIIKAKQIGVPADFASAMVNMFQYQTGTEENISVSANDYYVKRITVDMPTSEYVVDIETFNTSQGQIIPVTASERSTDHFNLLIRNMSSSAVSNYKIVWRAFIIPHS